MALQLYGFGVTGAVGLGAGVSGGWTGGLAAGVTGPLLPGGGATGGGVGLTGAWGVCGARPSPGVPATTTVRRAGSNRRPATRLT